MQMIYIHSQNDHLTFQDKSLDILSLIRLLSQCPVVFPEVVENFVLLYKIVLPDGIVMNQINDTKRL